MVSIVVPVYKAEKVIAQTIQSVLRQTFTDWELILVDDCSPDNSYKEIEPFLEDKRITYARLEKNSGAATARNKGIELAKGRYIAFLDADDIWMESKLEKQLSLMTEKDAAMSCHDFQQMSEDGREKGRVIHCLERCDYIHCLYTNRINTTTVIYDTEKIGKQYFTFAPLREDFATWLRMLRTDVDYVYGVREVLCYYRIVKGSVSRNKIKMIKYQYRLFRDFEHFSVLRAAYHTAMWCVVKILRIK